MKAIQSKPCSTNKYSYLNKFCSIIEMLLHYYVCVCVDCSLNKNIRKVYIKFYGNFQLSKVKD